MLHIILLTLSNRETVFLHNVNVEFIFSIYRNFVSQLSGIFSHFLVYVKSVIILFYFFGGFWIQKDAINNVISNPTSFSSVVFYIYLIGFPLIWWLIPRLIGYGFRSIMSRNVRLYSYSFVQKNTYGATEVLQFSKIRKSMDVHFLDGGAWRASFLEFKLFQS